MHVHELEDSILLRSNFSLNSCTDSSQSQSKSQDARLFGVFFKELTSQFKICMEIQRT